MRTRTKLVFMLAVLLGLSAVAAVTLINESQLSLSDVTTLDVSTAQHGFAPKAPNDATQELMGTGAWGRNKWIEGRQALVAATSSAGPSALGDIQTTVGTGSDIVADASNCTRRRVSTTAVLNNAASISGGANYWTGRNIWFEACAGTANLLVQRTWISLSSQTVANTLANDNGSTASFAGFRFSTNVPDTHWMACTKTSGSGAPTCTDTGITPDTNTHLFEIRFNDATPNIVFMIDGSVVATATSNLPASGVGLRYAVGIATLEAVIKAADFGYVKIRSDK